jgi:hypothetical protein
MLTFVRLTNYKSSKEKDFEKIPRSFIAYWVVLV